MYNLVLPAKGNLHPSLTFIFGVNRYVLHYTYIFTIANNHSLSYHSLSIIKTKITPKTSIVLKCRKSFQFQILPCVTEKYETLPRNPTGSKITDKYLTDTVWHHNYRSPLHPKQPWWIVLCNVSSGESMERMVRFRLLCLWYWLFENNYSSFKAL